jgi:hypothetical protein
VIVQRVDAGRRASTTLAMALCLLGCGSAPRGEQVPLVTVGSAAYGGCVLQHQVVDVIADRTYGTVIKGTGMPLRWPSGFTGWRAGAEVEVLDAAGAPVLRTGGRYWLYPVDDGNYSKPLSEWVIGSIEPCADCELGYGID